MMNNRFPINYEPPYMQRDPRRGLKVPRFVPWDLVEGHEKQAQKNHCGQTLKRLAERGGLYPIELICVLQDRPYDRKMTLEESLDLLNKIIDDNNIEVEYFKDYWE